MRNNIEKAAGSRLLSKASELPYFTVESAGTLLNDKIYLKILLSRYSKNGRVLRLKKGVYVTTTYIDNIQKRGAYTSYLEFTASAIYPDSYLSMEYVLQKYNALTESAANFTLVSRNKTISFSNPLGKFIYHNIKKDLFTGFKPTERDGFIIFEATKAKALFDYLYFRKRTLTDNLAIEELRINKDVFDKKDMKELNGYLKLEGSSKMRGFAKALFNYAF